MRRGPPINPGIQKEHAQSRSSAADRVGVESTDILASNTTQSPHEHMQWVVVAILGLWGLATTENWSDFAVNAAGLWQARAIHKSEYAQESTIHDKEYQ